MQHFLQLRCKCYYLPIHGSILRVNIKEMLPYSFAVTHVQYCHTVVDCGLNQFTSRCADLILLQNVLRAMVQIQE